MYVCDWETKELILRTGWILSILKCCELSNVLTSNSGSEFGVAGLDFPRAESLIIMSLCLLFSSFIVPTQGNGHLLLKAAILLRAEKRGR